MVIYHCVLYDLADVSREAVKSKLDAHPYFYLSLDSSWKIELYLNWKTRIGSYGLHEHY